MRASRAIRTAVLLGLVVEPTCGTGLRRPGSAARLAGLGRSARPNATRHVSAGDAAEQLNADFQVALSSTRGESFESSKSGSGAAAVSAIAAAADARAAHAAEEAAKVIAHLEANVDALRERTKAYARGSTSATGAGIRGLEPEVKGAGLPSGGPAEKPADIFCNLVELFDEKPKNCMMGHGWLWKEDELRAAIPEFAALWKRQTAEFPWHCCMGLNHVFALWFTTKKLKPRAVIESGVAGGHETWMLRQTVGPHVPIFAIDPTDPQYGYNPKYNPGASYFRDTNNNTRYLVGGYFKDFAKLEWDKLIPDPQVRAHTLVVLDDHQSCVSRFLVMQKYFFRWAFYEDNYPLYVSASPDQWTCPKITSPEINTIGIKRDFPSNKFLFGDAFSVNAACGGDMPKDTDKVIYKDHFGLTCRYITRQQHELFRDYLQFNLAYYFEFPALYHQCAKAKRPPLLQKGNTSALAALGLPKPEWEIWSYGTLFPAFAELRLMQPESVEQTKLLVKP